MDQGSVRCRGGGEAGVLQGLETVTYCYANTKWFHITLNTLFCGTKPVPIHLLRTIEEEEVVEMREAMAEAEEDERSGDGGMEISSDNEYH